MSGDYMSVINCCVINCCVMKCPYTILKFSALCLALQPEVEKHLRLVDYSTRYAVGLFVGDGSWTEEWGMKYFDDLVIRFIAINGGHTTTSMLLTFTQFRNYVV